jgi:hypothetical protein
MRGFSRDYLESIKTSASMESVAIDMGLDPKSNRRVGRYLYMNCPACWSDRAYIVEPSRHGWPLWGCFSCRKKGDIITLVRFARRDWTFREVLLYLRQFAK